MQVGTECDKDSDGIARQERLRLVVFENKDDEDLKHTFAPVLDFSIVLLQTSIEPQKSCKYIRSITVVLCRMIRLAGKCK